MVGGADGAQKSSQLIDFPYSGIVHFCCLNNLGEHSVCDRLALQLQTAQNPVRKSVCCQVCAANLSG